MTKVKLSIEYDKAHLEDHGMDVNTVIQNIQDMLYSTEFSFNVTVEDTPQNEPNVTVEEIKKLIDKWYSAYSVSPSESLFMDIKLMEAMRRDYEH